MFTINLHKAIICSLMLMICLLNIEVTSSKVNINKMDILSYEELINKRGGQCPEFKFDYKKSFVQNTECWSYKECDQYSYYFGYYWWVPQEDWICIGGNPGYGCPSLYWHYCDRKAWCFYDPLFSGLCLFCTDVPVFDYIFYP